MNRALAALVLGVLVLLGVHLKLRLSMQGPRFDPGDETGYFRAESALQYRYARLAASGKGIPALDKDAQWPEGLDTKRSLTSVMEKLTGLSWRLIGGGDFRMFVLLWTAFVSSLSIAAMYFCARRLADPPVALAAAAAYGLSWAAQSNVAGAYRLETLGLPLLFASLACRGPLSAAFLVAAFSSWHLARFYLPIYLAACGFAYWRTKEKALIKDAAWALAAGILFLPFSADKYGHVYGLVWAKLKHGFVHPENPAQLDAIQRLEWTGPSNSPDLGFLVFTFLPLAAVLAAWRPEKSSFGTKVDFLTLAFAGATALSSRMAPWLAFFLVLSATRGRRYVLVFAAVALMEAAKCWAPASPLNPFMRLSAPLTKETLRPAVSLQSERQLLAFMRKYGGKPTLAPMGLSAQILTYAETPVLLHPKWEAADIREKTAAFAKALFEDEESFARFMGDASLFVYGADMILDETPEGLRYASGKMAVDESSAAYLFHFSPQKLRSFRLVFQNEDYRVYSKEPNRGEAFPPLPVYDRAQYGPDLDCKDVLRRMQLARLQLVMGRVLGRMGRGEEALSAYDESFKAWPPDAGLRQEYNALKSSLERAP